MPADPAEGFDEDRVWVFGGGGGGGALLTGAVAVTSVLETDQ